MNEHETSSGVNSFEDMNLSHSTTENNSVYNLSFSEDKEEEANIQIYTIITRFKLVSVFSIT